jgi:hypothetical protein
MRRLTRIERAGCATALAACAVLAGCATPATSTNMTMRAADATTSRQATPEALKANVALRDVTGGKETNPMWMSSVGSSEFERALEDSLRSVGMLAANRQSGRFQLVAHLAKLDQPFGGFDMTVTATVNYLLIERASGKTVWEKSLTTPYTAKLGDALVGTARMRLANEGTIRQNISQLVAELQQLKAGDIALR